jgi:hypothetical protein
LKAESRPVKAPSLLAVVDIVREEMREYEYATATESKLTSTSEVLEAIEEPQDGKATGPNAVLNTACCI